MIAVGIAVAVTMSPPANLNSHIPDTRGDCASLRECDETGQLLHRKWGLWPTTANGMVRPRSPSSLLRGD